jgi:hypothetical protein
LKNGFEFSGEALCLSGSGALYSVYKDKRYIVIQEEQTFSLRKTKSQLVLPISTIKWICASIKDGFWRKPSDGGLPKDQHFIDGEFDGEKIRIRRSMNAGVENEIGFTITNLSRDSYISPSSRQSGIYTDKLLFDFILPIFESLG